MKKPSNPEEFIARNPQWEKQMHKLREILLESGMDEVIKWMFPVYMINNGNVCGLSGAKDYCGVWFFQGALLSDPYELLENAQEGKTHAMRHLRYYKGDKIDEDVLRVYIDEAVQNEINGLRVKIPKKKQEPIKIPEAFDKMLKSHAMLQMAFDKLSAAKQRDHISYYSSAKREKTKADRLEKCKQWLLEGKSPMDQYR